MFHMLRVFVMIKKKPIQLTKVQQIIQLGAIIDEKLFTWGQKKEIGRAVRDAANLILEPWFDYEPMATLTVWTWLPLRPCTM